jgi:hypothetical protein
VNLFQKEKKRKSRKPIQVKKITAYNQPDCEEIMDNSTDVSSLPGLLNILRVQDDEGAEDKAARAVAFKAAWDKTSPAIREGQNDEGDTVLQFMAVHGFEGLIQDVLHDAPSLAGKATHARGEYPIHTAILNGFSGSEEALAVVNKLFECDPQSGGYKTLQGRTALHYAARYGSLEMVKCCYENYQGNIDEEDRDGMTALAWAVNEGQEAVQAYLIEQGADQDLVNLRSRTQASM